MGCNGVHLWVLGVPWGAVGYTYGSWETHGGQGGTLMGPGSPMGCSGVARGTLRGPLSPAGPIGVQQLRVPGTPWGGRGAAVGALMGGGIEKIQSAKSGLNEACVSLITRFEVCFVRFQ